MEKAKTQNRKFIIALAAMGLALIGVIGALIGVYAASYQTLSSSFNINYSISNTEVAARIKTEYTIGDSTTIATTDIGGQKITNEEGYYVVNAGAQSTNPTLDIGVINITPETPQVEFTFTIENLIPENEDGYNNVIACNLSLERTKSENMLEICQYSYDGGSWETADMFTSDGTNWYSLTSIGDGKVLVVKFIIKVDNVNSIASFSNGNFVLHLTSNNAGG